MNCIVSNGRTDIGSVALCVPDNVNC